MNTSVLHVISLSWIIINAFIISDPESILPYLELDPSFLEISKEEILNSVTPCLYFFRIRYIKPRISNNKRLAYDVLDELFNIKSKQIKARITNNAVIVLHQIFLHFNNPRHHEDKRLDKLSQVMSVWDVHRIVGEMFKNLSSNKYKYIKSNIENKNLRYFILTAIIMKYFTTLHSKIRRDDLRRMIQK